VRFSLDPVELELAGHAVRAVSWAGLETCIELPGWRLCFDIGRCPPSAINHQRVLFTHGHIDHIGGVAHHCGSRHLRKMPPPIYVIPQEHHSGLAGLMDAFRALDRSELPCVLEPVGPGDQIELGRGRYAVAFRAVHRVPTLGYALRWRRSALDPALQGEPPHEIARRRAAGESISVTRDTVEVAFCGDTTIDVVLREELVRTARLLILECTFLDDTVSVDRARKTGHVHLDEVVAHADRFENEAILLTHFSLRHGPSDIRRILADRLPESLRDRVVPLLVPRPPALTER
jgi:ribonuclease Z